MSSQHQYMTVNNTPSTRVGDIEHISHLSEHIGSLCLSSEYSDVTLIVEGQRIPAHKVILAASSDYFRALLYGGMREANQAEVELQAPLQAFKALLRYVYSGHMGLSNLREDTVLDMLGLAHQFDFQELEAAISDYLRQVLALRNVCSVLDAARLYGLDALMDYCYNFLDRNATEVLQHDSFLQLSVEALQGLLERDSFFAPEVDIFKAVCKWFEANQQWVKSESGQAQVEKILKCVRLTLMSLEELLRVVRPFAPVTPDMLLDAIHDKTRTRSTDLRHRGLLLPEENVATLKRGARVIAGDMRSALLDGDCENYDMERGYTRHTISDDPNNPGILVRLPAPTILNHLRLLLWDRDNRSYAYFIEVSVDQKDWVRVIEHSKYYCRSWQNLYFPARVVQYIKIVGTSNTVNKVFHAVALEAMHTARVPPLSNGLVRPLHNVATVELSAVVIEGISRSRNALLNGDTEHYDWEQGYTCHQLGSGAIVVQLAQPYLLSSIRLLLWDCDYRHYSYYVETSVNYWDWETVCDRTRDAARSWQVIYFSPRPVSIIRVVGTNNSVNEVFHMVHLECPAQVEEASGDPAAKKPRADSQTPTPAGNNSNAVAAAPAAAVPRAASPPPSPPAPPAPEQPLPPAETATEAEERYDDE
ncbi:BTB/POZ domain-containing protein 9 [Cydia splendana]|uniref:BTB/POZ domain-containing protein 9 n=1 Tax=Cydia splendana TaxID=1100963 RepID=UPI0028F478CB